MQKSEFNFKKYQNFSKSRKMVIRFIIYSVVIAVLSYLISRTDKGEIKTINEGEIEQIEIEMDEVIVN